MKTIHFTICLLGLIVVSSVLSFGECQNQKCSFNTTTNCYRCVTGTGFACSPEATSCPQSCTESRCPTKTKLVCDPDTGICCDPDTGICIVPAGTLGSLQEINLQPRLLDREFLAAIRPASGPQCQIAELPKNILFSL